MEQEALNFIRSLQALYLENRNMDAILNNVDERISCIGTGEHEIFKNLEQAAQSLQFEKDLCTDGFKVTDSWYEAVPISPNACIVYGEVWATPNNIHSEIADFHNRITAVCIKKHGEIKLLHMHLSSSDDNQENDEYYVKSNTKIEKKVLKMKIEQTTEELSEKCKEFEILAQNIPGGVYRCKNDSLFTLMNVSGGFISMFGYTREEIKALFNDCFINMVYEPDRAGAIESVQRQISNNATIELEYRVVCKNGDLIWVLDRSRLVKEADNTQTFFSMIIDITLRKAEKEDLRLLLERHRVIMDQATDILFEWNMQTDTIDFSSNWEKKFGYKPISTDITKDIPKSFNIHPDDMVSFLYLENNTILGIPYSEAEFRIRNISGNYKWCRIRATTQFDSDKKPIKAIGIIVDIDDEKNKSTMLLEAAQCDALTRLYNKNATKYKIEQIISDKGTDAKHALLIIDVDNFKTINDRFGHQCGDAVLSNMAQCLKHLFRSTDVIGRIGGDEFLVFMANINSSELVAAKAHEIVEIFKQIPEEIGGDLSCSVGVAFYPNDASNYATLSRCADSALYNVKRNGKVNFAFYKADINHGIYCTPMRTVICDEIHEPNALNGDLIQYSFNLLYSTSNINSAINQILEMVGRCYDVSRVYIFENSQDDRYCSNTFEWCNVGVEPQINNLQNLSFEMDLEGFFDLFDENGVFYCQNVHALKENLCAILEAQNVFSVLQCLILDDGVFKGYIGFDECTKKRYWTAEQIHTLTLITNILSTFLVKQKQKERILKLEADIK